MKNYSEQHCRKPAQHRRNIKTTTTQIKEEKKEFIRGRKETQFRQVSSGAHSPQRLKKEKRKHSTRRVQIRHAKPLSIWQRNQIKIQNPKITKTSHKDLLMSTKECKRKTEQIIGSIAAWPPQSGPTVQRGGDRSGEESVLHNRHLMPKSYHLGQSGFVCVCVREGKRTKAE